MEQSVIKIIDKGQDGYLLIVENKEISFRTFANAEAFIKKLSQETRQDYVWEYDSDYVAEKSIAPASIRSVQQLTPLMVADYSLSGLAGESDDIAVLRDFFLEQAYQAGKDYINDEYTDTNIVKLADLYASTSPLINVPEIELKERIVEGGLDEIARIENISL